jgi:hypothetical protein
MAQSVRQGVGITTTSSGNKRHRRQEQVQRELLSADHPLINQWVKLKFSHALKKAT